MDSFDFQSLLPYVISAYTAVYGEEYHSFISQKLNNSIMISYYDIEGLHDYISYIKICKSREFSLRFLEKIGMDIEEYKTDTYADPLTKDIQEILKNLIGSSDYGFSSSADYWIPLLAFDSNNSAVPTQLLENKITILNFLRGDGHEQITKENFNAFTKTTVYKELLKIITQYKKIYETLLLEYNKWAKKLLPYETFLKPEMKRKKEIFKKKETELFRDIFAKLSPAVTSALAHKTETEQQNAILGNDITSISFIELFSNEQMEKLKSSDTDLWNKYFITFQQTTYLKELGILIPNEDVLKCDSEESITNYLNFLNGEKIRDYIPSEELIHYTSSTRKRKYEEALKEYYTTRKDVIEAMKIANNNLDAQNTIYDIIKNKQICILTHITTNDKGEYTPVMFYTIKDFSKGLLDFAYLHECGHIIDMNHISFSKCGFDITSNLGPKNPYDKAYRKYERFNETLNDIFAGEAITFLRNHGIYLMEPKEFTLLDTSNLNTALLTKNLLQPLLQKFRPQVVKAKVNSAFEELTQYIGEKNFEDLVDVVNKVDYLTRNGLIPKMRDAKEDSIVIEYYEQLKRVKQIYRNIDEYYEKHFKGFNI